MVVFCTMLPQFWHIKMQQTTSFTEGDMKKRFYTVYTSNRAFIMEVKVLITLINLFKFHTWKVTLGNINIQLEYDKSLPLMLVIYCTHILKALWAH